MTVTNRTRKSSWFTGTVRILLASMAVVLTATACRNPLVGMGARVDLNPPSGEVSGITNGDYVSGDIILTGTIEDDKQPDAVWATVSGYDIDGNPITPVDVQGTLDSDGNWEIGITTGDSDYGVDGEKDITISLRDTSGKITEKQMLLFFDNTPPVLMVTSPDLDNPQDSTPITIRGEAYDPLRLKEVRASIGQGSIDLIGLNQGTADSWLFEIDHSVNGTEALGIVLEAEDQAGNISQAVFHTKDLRFLNNNEFITVIELYNLVEGTSLTDEVITPLDVEEATVHTGLPSGSSSTHLTFGGGTVGLPLDVDMSGDIPQISITTPNPAESAANNTLGPASKITGTVSDNVEVDESTIEIRILEDDNSTVVLDWDTVSSHVIINDQNVNISHSLPYTTTIPAPAGFITDGTYFLEVRAQDNNGTQGLVTDIPFNLDGNAPVVDVTSPALNAYIPDTSVLIEGTATDTEAVDVEISLDGGSNWETVANLGAGGGSWSYQISDWEIPYPGSFSDFDTIAISVRATAGTSTTYSNHSLILDRTPPVIEFLTPEDGRDSAGDITGDVNGVVTLKVTVSDDSLDTVTRQIGLNGTPASPSSGTIYSWSEIIVTTDYEDPNLATEISSGIWELPIYVTATDKAGNVTNSTDYSLIIDNSRDRPEVTVIYPIDGESYGGEVTVSGITFDDDGTVGAVYVQLDLDTTDGNPTFVNDSYAFVDGIDFDGSGPVTDFNESDSYRISGLTNWSLTLNSTGELYNTDTYSGGSGHNGDVYVKIWAEDPIDPSVTSVPEILHFRFDDTLPRIDTVEIDGEAVTANKYVSGTIDLDVSVSDDTQINKLEVSYDNGISWEDLGVTPATVVNETITIDTSTAVSGGNGILYLRLKATDDTGYPTLESYPLNVDNNAPEGTYPGAEPIVLDGTEALVQGTASDPNGSIAGVDRIEVYLTREVETSPGVFEGFIYNALSLAYDYETAYDPDIATEETTFGAGLYYPVDPAGAGVMVIDDVNELGEDDISGDDDDYDESLTLIASTWNWWVEFNSENIPDGDITINYVVVDKAGNRTHYTKGARIENNPPVLESVVLGTDINYTAAVDQTVGNGESFRYVDGTGTDGSGIYYVDFDSAVSGITTRNGILWIDADHAAGNGNGAAAGWTWELLYKGGGSNLLGAGIDSAEITDFTGMPDEADVSYILRVTDDAGLSDEVELILTLDNTDSTPPTVNLTPLTNTYSSIIDARGGSANHGYPVPGYSPSETPLWGSADGRLREVGIDEYDGDDADVSGTIIVSGIASDDKTLHEVELTVDNYNGGLGVGQPFVILEWDASANGGLGGLVASGTVIGTPHISSESYGESAGHVVSWSFEFDTAAITNGAGDNIQVEAIARDKTSNNNSAQADGNHTYTMDVMPFVTGIQMSNAAYTDDSDIIRTRYGAWPIREDSYLKITGFNLGSTVGLVSSDAGDSTIPDLADTVSALSGVTVTGDRTMVTGQALSIDRSGWLILETNSVPMMNYHGDFDESDSTHDFWTGDSLWNDDRYIDVWNTNHDFYDLADSGYAVWGAMTVDPTDGQPWASWTDYTTSRIFFSSEMMADLNYDNNDGDGIFYGYDPSEYTDVAIDDYGTPYVSYLANLFGGNPTAWPTSGGLVLWGDRADWSDNGTAYDAREDARIEEVERFSEDERLWQFRNHRMAVANEGTDAHIYMSYYDDYSKALKFAHFYDTGTDIHNVTFEALEDWNNSATDEQHYIVTNGGWDTNIIAGTQNPSDNNDKGYWSDITTDTNGFPVVVYLDTWNSTLNLAIAGSRNPLNHSETGGDWTTVSDISNLSTVGYYPSIKIDSTGRIHIIAYRVLTGDILYFSAASLADAAADNFDVRDHIIDSSGNVGAHADLDLLDDVPVVTYMNGAYSGTYSGLKYAYLKEFDWSAGTVADTIEWEHGTVPLENLVNNARMSVAGPPRAADNYQMTIGFHSDTYNYVQLRKELP